VSASGQDKVPAATCPSCDRFIGPADRCPYCGADSAKAPILRHLRVAALGLAAVGLVFLYLMARAKETPAVRIGEISPAMNFATVRVSGVVSGVFVGDENGRINYVSFYLADPSGELQVKAYRGVAAALAGKGRVPARGSSVEVTGNLRVAADGKIRLFLLAEDQLRGSTNAWAAGGDGSAGRRPRPPATRRRSR